MACRPGPEVMGTEFVWAERSVMPGLRLNRLRSTAVACGMSRQADNLKPHRMSQGGWMAAEDDDALTGIDNAARLAALRSGDPETGSEAPGGPLPWDSKPSVPPQAPADAPAAAPLPPSDPWPTPGSAPQYTPMPAAPPAAALAVAPGVYPGQQGELLYWNGASWDPRPVAPIWTRVWCWAIDQILVNIPVFLLVFLVAFPVALVFGSESVAPVVVGLIAFPVAYVGYFACTYVWMGRSPAMVLGRLYVVQIKTGERLTWGAAWLRALVLCVANVSGILAIIWLGVASGNPRKQGPHDSAAKSVVLRRA